ncbi:GLPGLI family protein [Flavobacteriaceae bacterium]|jgi:GLPGLI family protein|nr:GLPGLI family protein [Flavobacteriaceae bacterium]MDG1383963.1 GLPGLI family protein [Flavobacteriaceae bacterium]
MFLRKNLFLMGCIMLLFSAVTSAQEFQGKAYYFSKTSVDMDSWGGRKMTEDQKKQIADRMRSMFEKTYILTFDREASTYKEEEVLEAPGGKGGFGRWGNSFSAGLQYKNIKSQQFLQDQEFFGKQFLISDSLSKLDWKLGTETKQIGQYLCMKATTTKTVDEFDWRSMRRKSKLNKDTEVKKDSTVTSITEDIEVPKQIEVTAWYAPQIPVSQGPGDFWGLPGLILEVNTDKTTVLCSKIIMNPKEKVDIEAPKKGAIVTRSEYNETVKKKMEEMRSMYGGRKNNRRN